LPPPPTPPAPPAIVAHNIFKTFADAQAYCQDAPGGKLAEPRSALEDALIRQKATQAGLGKYWLGGKDDQTETVWKWASDGVSWWTGVAKQPGSGPLNGMYTNWKASEPNMWNHDEDCLMVDQAGLWNDLDCAKKLAFMCEVSAEALCGGSLC
jgi:hypothetical protein